MAAGPRVALSVGMSTNNSPVFFAPPAQSLLEDRVRCYAEGAAFACRSAPTLDGWLQRRAPEPAAMRLEDLDFAFEPGFIMEAEEIVTEELIEEELIVDSDELLELAA
jgi:hypothetical protein